MRVVSEEVEGISYLYPAGLLAGGHTGGPGGLGALGRPILRIARPLGARITQGFLPYKVP